MKYKYLPGWVNACFADPSVRAADPSVRAADPSV